MGRVLVTTPFVGELGWEIFSWQPLIRSLAISEPWDKIIVYTRPGRSLLYPWAEVRDNPPGPDHEPECLLWHDFDKTKTAEFNAMTSIVTESAKAEFGPDAAIFSIASLDRFNYPFYERGSPDLLKIPVIDADNDNQPLIVLCVRDRPMSDYRNWPIQKWRDLAEKLPGNVKVVGKVQNKCAWEDVFANSDNRINLDVNETTIDDLIHLFSVTDLAIGGSTGTLHLASRCACDHLVWGGEKEVHRYAETNWFGARHKVMEVGWDPEVVEVIETAKEMQA